MAQPQSHYPAYILHARPYRDFSLILELLTAEFGRIGCVARGARRGKQRCQRALQPFTPLLVTLGGRSNLKTLKTVESAGAPLWLQGRAVYAGIYANELLMRSLAEGEMQYSIFADYQTLLDRLALLSGNANIELEAPLRCFELNLLTALGNCPQLDICAQTGERMVESAVYQLIDETGFVPVSRAPQQRLRAGEFTAIDLLSLAQALRDESFSAVSKEMLLTAKRLTRILLTSLLGRRPLRSRELFGQIYCEDQQVE